MITVEIDFIANLFVMVADMFTALAPIITGIFSILIFSFLVRQILHWIKIMKYV